MDKFPGPVHADRADEAEARRRDLRNRFRAVSRRIDRRGSGSGGRDGWNLSPFEIVLMIAGIAFLVWAAGYMFGAW